MEVTTISVSNFGSYKSLTWNTSDRGLTLVSGANGSGKSTLCDIIPWVLFGKTAKGGAVDEVRSWAGGDTAGYARVLMNGAVIEIWRTRGASNDLYYHVEGETVRRGKDLADTQKQINQFLGLDLDLYLSGAYFHEFSQTSQFFTAPAKTRRQIIEQMVDLELAISLTAATSEYKKELKQLKDTIQKEHAALVAQLAYLDTRIPETADKVETWEHTRYTKITTLEQQKYNFDSDKASRIREIKKQHLNKRVELTYDLGELEKEIKTDEYFAEQEAILSKREAACGDNKCSECGAWKDNSKRMAITKDRHGLMYEREANDKKKIQQTRLNNSLKAHLLTLEPQLTAELGRVNTFSDAIKTLRKERNPYTEIVEKLRLDREATATKFADGNKDLEEVSVELADLELLQTATDQFRAKLIETSVMDLQSSVNALLEEHFDAELRVTFSIAEADKLDVTIYKDGNQATFTQLSKGQRQLLKLSFGVSVMRVVANHHGVNFTTLFFDEAFDGLSDEMKTKAFGLLRGLATGYSSIFCVEHSEALKGQFNNSVEVTLVNGESQLAET